MNRIAAAAAGIAAAICLLAGLAGALWLYLLALGVVVTPHSLLLLLRGMLYA